MPSDKLRGRLNGITFQKASSRERLTKTETHLRLGAERVLAYVDLLENPGDLYVSLAGNTRRDLLAAFFQRPIVYVEDDGIHVRPVRTDVNEALHDWQANTAPTDERAFRVSAEGSSSSTPRGNLSDGLSNNQLVGVTGFEPAASSSRTTRATKLRHTPLPLQHYTLGRGVLRPIDTCEGFPATAGLSTRRRSIGVASGSQWASGPRGQTYFNRACRACSGRPQRHARELCPFL